MKPDTNQLTKIHAHEIGVMVENFGPLNLNTRLLVKLSATLISQPIEEIKEQITQCLIAGITPSEIYQTIFIITDTIGLTKSLKALTIAQDALNEL